MGGGNSIEGSISSPLYALCTQKEEIISNMWSPNERTWVLLFRRELRVWESNRLVDLVRWLQEVILNPNKPDVAIWRGSVDGIFSVKSAYRQ